MTAAVPLHESVSSPEHEQRLYERYMPLVRRIAMRVVRTLPANVTLDDLLSAGWLGLSEALGRRTSAMNEEQFEAYASHRVRGAILDHLRMLDPLSRKLRGASRRITEVTAQLGVRLGRAPTEEEISAELGVSLPEYHKLLGDIANGGLARLEIMASDGPVQDTTPELLAERREMVDRIAHALDSLPERLKLVVGLHYQEECSFREIGEILGVTESRVCQLHAEAIHRVRAKLETRSDRAPRRLAKP
ncbi:MAG: FliA/WhiG family RNA polymerase sigma factor [Pseudomonadota bacterium]